MINRTRLLADLKLQVRDLEADLRGRFASHTEYRDLLTVDWRAASDAGRTAEALETWAEAQFTQSAVAWVLACVFVRFCEDNDLLDAPLIAGTDSRGQSAVARQDAFYLEHPTDSDNDYLRDVFAAAGRLPGLSDVFKVQRSLLAAPVSADMGKQLVRLFRATDADSGALIHHFTDPDWNTRFLGDLYQDLSETARKRFALLQTPESAALAIEGSHRTRSDERDAHFSCVALRNVERFFGCRTYAHTKGPRQERDSWCDYEAPDQSSGERFFDELVHASTVKFPLRLRRNRSHHAAHVSHASGAR